MSELKRELFNSPDVAEDRSEHRGDAGESPDRPEGAPEPDESTAEETVEEEHRPFRRRRTLRRRNRRKRKRRRISLAVLPTLLTLGNGVCGLAAIALAMSPALQWSGEQKLFAAGVLIFAGMLFDALDGSAARLTGQASQFGAQLDSLCDAITFGTAPAVIVWQISNRLPQRVTWAIGVLFALCVLIRLARFNVETNEEDTHEGFDGLPSPAAAGTLAALAIAMPDLAEFATDEAYPILVNQVSGYVLEGSHYFTPLLALVLAFLMVSRFQYPHLVQQWVRGRRPPHQIGQALFVLVGVFLLHWLTLPLVFCYFALSSPVKYFWDRHRHRHSPPAT